MVTQSFEYPFASPERAKSVLEDTDGDGKADKFIHFDDTLNIPIGILPVKDGAVAFSIPNVMHFTDADGDGKPESQQRLYAPFEYKDTHGMVNNLLMAMTDIMVAMVYQPVEYCRSRRRQHSFDLREHYPFQGRRQPHRAYTAGRINPFGLAFDELGYLYSTDCHTPYTVDKRGDYSQWGKEEGMGFAPDMKPFENEATALAGLAYYADVKYPEAYQKNLFIGDVVASSIQELIFL